MTDRGYNNFYTPDEYESYQQCPLDNYGQTPEARLEETMIKFMEMQQQISQMQQMQDQHQQYLKNSLARRRESNTANSIVCILQSVIQVLAINQFYHISLTYVSVSRVRRESRYTY